MNNELDKAFWMKVKEEYDNSYVKDSSLYELCFNSDSFKDAFEDYTSEIITLVKVFFKQANSIHFKINHYAEYGSRLFIMKLPRAKLDYSEFSGIRKDFIDWCINNSK